MTYNGRAPIVNLMEKLYKTGVNHSNKSGGFSPNTRCAAVLPSDRVMK